MSVNEIIIEDKIKPYSKVKKELIEGKTYLYVSKFNGHVKIGLIVYKCVDIEISNENTSCYFKFNSNGNNMHLTTDQLVSDVYEIC